MAQTRSATKKANAATSKSWRRTVHHKLGQILPAFYIFMTFTGVVWTIWKKWIGGSEESTQFLLNLHHMNYMGLQYFYCPLLCVMSVVFFTNGFGMTSLWRKAQLNPPNEHSTVRQQHAFIGTIWFLPMMLLAISGGVYSVSIHWLNAKEEDVHWLMQLHNMSIIGIGGIWPILLAGTMGALINTGVSLCRDYREQARLGDSNVCKVMSPFLSFSRSLEWSRREIHHQLGQILLFFYAYMTVTGLVWTVWRLWFEGSKEETHFLMALHQMEFFGLQYIYPPLLCIASIIFFITGFGMTSIWWKRKLPVVSTDMTQRQKHALLGAISFLPMMLLAITGGVYTVARKWFNADKESIHWVIHLHNMAALSIGGVWPLIIAVMIGALICTGAPLSRMWKGIFPSKAILSRYPAPLRTIVDDDTERLISDMDTPSTENMLESGGRDEDADMDITAMLLPKS